MKKLTAIFLGLVMVASLAACGSEAPEPSEVPASGSSFGTENAAEPEEAEEPESSADTNPSETEPEAADEEGSANILIAYFTMPEDVDTDGVDAIAGASIVVRDGEAMGNVEYMAGVIQETVGGDLFRIETVRQYPLDHDPLVDQAAEEQDENARPELATHIENPDQYDTIFLGYPSGGASRHGPWIRLSRPMILPGRR